MKILYSKKLLYYKKRLNAKPVSVATEKIHTKNVITSCFLNIEPRSDTSGILAPAPPIINATIVPSPTPFATSTLAIGIIVSVLIYIGIPKTAAKGTAKKLSAPANFASRSVGTNP